MGDYWSECISEAFEDAGITATKKQIDTVASWAEGAHENHGMATGQDVASSNFISEEAKELKKLKSEQEKNRQWIARTIPCKSCTTTGLTLDGWGRSQVCATCDGDGRIRSH